MRRKSGRSTNPLLGFQSLENRCLLAGDLVAFEQVSERLSVADINLSGEKIDPQGLVMVGDEAFFTAADLQHGRELWKSDGTSNGTVRITDLAPGEESAFDNTNSRGVVLNGKYYFVRINGPFGSQATSLWSSDGTSEGTSKIKELSLRSRFRELVVVNDTILIEEQDSLWISDGTADGTANVTSGNFLHITSYAFVGETLYFSGRQGADEGIWKTNATGEPEFVFSTDSPVGLTSLEDTLYFANGDPWRQDGNGVELWKSDGTAEGTVQVKDIAKGQATIGIRGPASAFPTNLTPFGDELYFNVSGLDFETQPPTPLASVWKTDGTEAGTVPVSTNPGELFSFDNALFLQLYDGLHTLNETAPFLPGQANQRFVNEAGIFVTTVSDSGRTELWKTDGTSEGNELLYSSHEVFSITDLGVLDQTTLFVLRDEDGLSFLKSSGGEVSNVRQPEVNDSSSPISLSAVGDTLFFSANNGVDANRQLWKLEQDEALQVSILPPAFGFEEFEGIQTSWSSLQDFLPIDSDHVVFTHLFKTSDHPDWTSVGRWISDGTEQGTIRLSVWGFDRGLDGPYLVDIPDHVVVDGTFYSTFGTFDGQTFAEPAINGADFTTVGDMVFFSRHDFESGRQLWVTNDVFQTEERLTGAVGETQSLLLSAWLTPYPNESEIVDLNGTAYFTAFVALENDFDEYAELHQLWKSDGSKEGTVRVASPDETHLSSLTVIGDRLFFTSGPSDARRLWVTDGTDDGSVQLMEFEALGDQFVAMDGALYFAAAGDNGMELWRSDGTQQGTFEVLNIQPGPEGSSPSWLTVVGERILFAAENAKHGREIWSSDGTAEGTRVEFDVLPGTRSSNPEQLAVVADQLYFSAKDVDRGIELWRAELASSAPLAGDINGDLEVDFADFLILSANFGTEATGVEAGDLNDDGQVSFADFLILSANFGKRL